MQAPARTLFLRLFTTASPSTRFRPVPRTRSPLPGARSAAPSSSVEGGSAGRAQVCRMQQRGCWERPCSSTADSGRATVRLLPGLAVRQHHSRPRSPAGSTPQQAALRRRRAHPPAARGTTAARPSRPSASCSRCALPAPGPTPATCESNGAHKARVGMLGKRRAWPPPARCLPAAAAAAPGVALSPLGLRAQRRGGRFLRVCRSASRGGGARPASLEAAVLTMLPRCARWLRLMTE